jgi:hypothetical protein
MRIRVRSFRLSLTLAVTFLWLAFVGPAIASDGVLEINTTCASAGCFAGDLPGFPVVITKAGSYRLTGNLAVVISSLSILDIRADHVTIDLNGFSLLGPQVCDVGSCGSSGSGYGIVSYNVFPTPKSTTIRNGTISGFNECLVLAAKGIHVQRLSISHCTAAGLHVGDDGLVLDNRVSNVSKSGIHMGSNTAFRDNVVTNADLSGTGTRFAFEGGRAVGGNICDDGSCSAYPPRRRFYLSQSSVTGGQALSACTPGFHMASLWEIWEPSGLRYDTQLGRAGVDSGSGPPAEGDLLPAPSATGWVRGIGNGSSDCQNWTSSAGSPVGTTAALSLLFGQVEDPWFVVSASCATTDTQVWCIED